MAWWDTDWPYRVKITAQSSQVDETISNYVYYYELSDLPADFWTNVTGVNDIRVTEGEDTQIPQDLIDFNDGTELGALFFKGTTNSTVDKDYYIYYGNAGASAIGASDTYGKYSCWSSSYTYVWTLADYTTDASGIKNSVADSNHGTLTGTISGDEVSQIAAKLEMTAINFDAAQEDHVLFAEGSTDLSFPLTMGCWFRTPDATPSISRSLLTRYGASGSRAWYFYFTTSGNISCAKYYDNTNAHTCGTSSTYLAVADQNQWRNLHLTISSAGTSVNFYKGGGAIGTAQSLTNSTIYQVGSNNWPAIGALKTTATGEAWEYENDYQFWFVANSEWSANRVGTHDNNQRDPTNFWTTATQESAPAGGSFRPQSIIIISS